MVLHPQFPPDVYLEGQATRQTMLSREHHGPRAVLNGLERLASGYGAECDRVRQDLDIAQAQLRDYQGRLGAPFPHDAYLSGLAGLRDQLRAGLSGKVPEEGAEPGPSVPELAEQIKALKAMNTIEAAPQRTGKRRVAAEEPVTARIRRRRDTMEPAEAAAMADPRLPPESPAPAMHGQPASPETAAHHTSAVRDSFLQASTARGR